MKLHLLALVVALCSSALCARADSYDFKAPFTKSGAFDANGVLILENVNGNVTVRTWEKNEILIEGEKSAATAEELEKIELTMAVSNARAEITVKLPKRSHTWFFGNNIRAAVRFTITLPASASVGQLQVVNSNVTIENVGGKVHAEAVNGTIRASGLAGDTRLQTVNGSIDVAFHDVSAKQELHFETVNGSIKVRLPAEAGANVRAETVNGGISSDFSLNTSGGFIGHSVHGTIGDGRASLRAHTVNGGIRIEKA